MNAILTGQNGIKGMEELTPEERQAMGDASRRYHGQDFMEKYYGRSAADRKYDASTGQEQAGTDRMYSDLMTEYGMSPETTLGQYFDKAINNAPNLADMVRNNPEKVKD